MAPQHRPSSLQLLSCFLLLLLLLPSAQAFVPASVPDARSTSFSPSVTPASSLSGGACLPHSSPTRARTPLPRLWQIRSDPQHTEDYFRFIEGKEVRGLMGDMSGKALRRKIKGFLCWARKSPRIRVGR